MAGAARPAPERMFVKERGTGMDFELGAFYTRDQVHQTLGGGDRQVFLASKDGIVIAAFLTDEKNREAPQRIYVGAGVGRIRKAKQLATQPDPIPVFRKGNKGGSHYDRYEFVGLYACAEYDESEEALAVAQPKCDTPVVGILRMRQAM